MPVRRLLLSLRFAFIGFCALSLFAFAVRWSAANPDGAVQKAFLGIAAMPPFLAETLANLTMGPFEKSRIPDTFSAFHRYRAVPNRTSHRVEGLVFRTGDSVAGPQRGWRILYGIFQIDGEPRYAALALSPDLAISHVWTIDRSALKSQEFTVGQAPAPHGFTLLRDGSIVAGWDNLYLAVRIDPCGNILWTSQAGLNHAIYATDGDRAWGPGFENSAQEIDLRDGKLLRSISMEDLRDANPDISALEMRRMDDNALGDNARGDASLYLYDAFHINDVEPLPPALAPAFPQFRASDLLISARSLNLVMVVDPDTLRIKWLTNDNMLRQHDPDWEPSGEISVFDNQNGRRFSRILAFNTTTGTYRTVLDGRAFDFYSRIRGKHQTLPNGGLLITSPGQGRIFEVGGDGRIALEMLVHDPAHPGKNFVVTEARFFPFDDPTFERLGKCPGK